MPLKPANFPKNERLKARKDFSAVYSGKKLSGKFFILYYMFAENGAGRKVAFTVSKKVNRLAVERNRLKRRLREVYRCNRDILPEDVLLIVRSLPRAACADFHEIREEVIGLFKRVASGKYCY